MKTLNAQKVVETRFERYEYKYWVPEPLVADLIDSLRPYLRGDAWALSGQRNTSLYLDSPEHELAQQHREKAPDRSKLRVRAYGDPPKDPAFVEVKRKVKAVCLKRRAVLPLAAVPSLLRGDLAALPSPRSGDEARTLEHFLYLMYVYRAEPSLLITCRRQAYASVLEDEEVRLTIDREICYQPASGPTLTGDRLAWRRLCGQGTYRSAASALIEVKFRGAAPSWVHDLIQRLGLFPGAFSKYVTAVIHHEQGPEALLTTDPRPAPFPAAPLRALRQRALVED